MVQVYSPIRFLKAKNKVGLVRITKQVTKKGKTFSQSFWVRPEDLPKTKPVANKQLPEAVKEAPGQEYKEVPIPYNRTNGFAMVYTKGDDSGAAILPSGVLHGAFELGGFTWVIHNSPMNEIETFSRYLVISEATTGMRAFGTENYQDDPDKLVEGFKAFLAHVEKNAPGKTAQLVKNATPMSELKDSPIDLSKFRVIRSATQKDKDKLIAKIISMLPNNSKKDDLLWDDVSTWVSYQFDENDSRNYDTDTFESENWDREPIIQYAIDQSLPMDEAHNEYVNVTDAIAQILNNNGDIEVDENDLTIENYLRYLRDDTNIEPSDLPNYDFDLTGYIGGDMWTHSAVMADAWNKGVDPQLHYQEIQESLEQDNFEDEEIDDGGFGLTDKIINSSYGTTFVYDELKLIGKWVTGAVRENRDEVKEQDAKRRSGLKLDIDDLEGLPEVMERQSRLYTDSTLYRGTPSTDWGKLEVGQIKSTGIVSFSKSERKALEFKGMGWLVIMEQHEHAPVYGVDVDDLIKVSHDQDAFDVIEHLKVNEYATEEEFIIRTPSLRVLAKDEKERRIWVETAEMDLIQMMKALFDIDPELEAALEESLNFRLHDPAEHKRFKK